MKNAGPIRYGCGFKYQLKEDWWVCTGILGCAAQIPDDDNSQHPWIALDHEGVLKIKEGYCWDGCSGPTWDDKTNMRAGLAHDALYQMFRAGKLPQEKRPAADRVLYDLCIQDGMSAVRAWCYRKAVNLFAAGAAARQAENVKTAP